MAGAVLNTLNVRLDAPAIAFMLDHAEAKVLIVDREFSRTIAAALDIASCRPFVITVDDPAYDGPGADLGGIPYEDLLAGGDPTFAWIRPSDEWNAISLNYTSGTTGNPKGVVYHHRGASPAVSGTNICLRKVDPAVIFPLIREHRVTHYCGAPIVHNTLLAAPPELRQGITHRVNGFVAGAAPPASTIEAAEQIGIDITHVYGLTETYGPATVCVKQEEWDTLPARERAMMNGRQGVPYVLEDDATVLDPQTMTPVPTDGETIGEVMFRGNIVMKGYLKNPKATEQAFAGGWFHSGDLAEMHPDGYFKIKGENISSLEVEDALHRHPSVFAAAVVAQPDEKWGETPCAFIELKPGLQATEADLIAHCRDHLAHYKVPRTVVFGPLPKTSTGKIQKFILREQARSTAAIV
jgi:fatty-acyl-CoA synthase